MKGAGKFFSRSGLTAPATATDGSNQGLARLVVKNEGIDSVPACGPSPSQLYHPRILPPPHLPKLAGRGPYMCGQVVDGVID